jgi:multidrug efflux pump subunit AcrB
MKLDTIRDLPSGAHPIEFMKDFGDTVALMLTVASPKVDDVEIALRARSINKSIVESREESLWGDEIMGKSIVICFPHSLNPRVFQKQRNFMAQYGAEKGVILESIPMDGPGFTGLHFLTDQDDKNVEIFLRDFLRARMRSRDLHPDVWPAVLITDPSETESKLREMARDKYSYRELDDFTDLIKRTLQTVPQVSKVTQSGVLEERIYLEYSQERMASYDVEPTRIRESLEERNIVLPGGILEVQGKNVKVDPSGEFKNEKEIGDVLIAVSSTGTPLYLRDAVTIYRGYESPPEYMNYFCWRDKDGFWQRSRAVTLGVQMRQGEMIAEFGKAVDEALKMLKVRLPEDLIIEHTSDQPLQVEENISLFMLSLYEAIALIVIVAFVGFWEWRSALVLALSIPVTLAMTFGMMHLLKIDVQQVSIASLIIALGLLVDDPVVAGDAIKRELEMGRSPALASWLGPTKLAKAIFFATLANIVAYFPLIGLSGNVGRFIFSLPVVLTCSLVASRIVSMVFVPLFGFYFLRQNKDFVPKEKFMPEGFVQKGYYRLSKYALDHRWLVFSLSLGLLGFGVFLVPYIKPQFFPKDLSYLSYVDVWLPEDAPLSATNDAVQKAEEIIQKTAEAYGLRHNKHGEEQKEILKSLTTFVGGGGPRFWFSVSPELKQLNYGQIIIQVKDKHDTQPLIDELQRALSERVVGARVDVRQLESGKPVGIPVSVRLSGQNVQVLKDLSQKLEKIFEANPYAERVRNDWGAESFVLKLQVDPDRANLAGISNYHVARSSSAALSGVQVTTLREGDKQIPVMLRLRMEERSQLSDVANLYVYSLKGPQKIPLHLVSGTQYQLEVEKFRRRNHFRTITVSCFPIPGRLPSEILSHMDEALKQFEKEIPFGYRMEIGGEKEEQVKGFHELGLVLLVSIISIYLVLVVQFNHAFKPLIVFAAIPYGVVGAFASLVMLKLPFGFMAFLGIASLIGVIVSHVIVLFDFIEELSAQNVPLREALLKAGIVRMRPVMITVGATVFGLFPLALHGGPLWEPLCFAQIGGLTLSTLITLVLVPVLYSIFVLDLKIIRWGSKTEQKP